MRLRTHVITQNKLTDFLFYFIYSVLVFFDVPVSPFRWRQITYHLSYNVALHLMII